MSLDCTLRTRIVFPNFSHMSDAAIVRQYILGYIDTFVITRWRDELHTAHYGDHIVTVDYCDITSRMLCHLIRVEDGLSYRCCQLRTRNTFTGDH